MGDRGAALDADYKPALFFADRHHGVVVKLTGIAQFSFDEDDRHLGSQPVHLPDCLFLFREVSIAGPVRHKHGKFQMLETVPQEPRGVVGEFKTAKPQLGAAFQSRAEGAHHNRGDETACDFDAVGALEHVGRGRVEKNGGD